MDFRTEIKIAPQPGLISHGKPIIMLGSCFSDSIGTKLKNSFFNAVVNPSGTLYNPASIYHALLRLANPEPYGVGDIFNHLGLWRAMSHHSSFAAPTAEEALKKMNTAHAAAHEAMKDAGALVITLGTTRIFTDRATGRVAANCHKLPADRFEEIDLTADQCRSALIATVRAFRATNHTAPVIFTVSPIRHMASGLEGNSLSKAKLRVAIDLVTNELPGCLYFPSYEIMLDDLRDYRFYAADMKHPSDVAVDYIFRKFCQWSMTEPTIKLAGECEKISRRISHRPMGGDSAEFNATTNIMIDSLLSAHPEIGQAVINRIKES